MTDPADADRTACVKSGGSTTIAGTDGTTMPAEGEEVMAKGIACITDDVDVVMTIRYGFPRWRGRPFLDAPSGKPSASGDDPCKAAHPRPGDAAQIARASREGNSGSTLRLPSLPEPRPGRDADDDPLPRSQGGLTRYS